MTDILLFLLIRLADPEYEKEPIAAKIQNLMDLPIANDNMMITGQILQCGTEWLDRVLAVVAICGVSPPRGGSSTMAQ